MRDGVRDLSHDHGELNRRVFAISARIHQPNPSGIVDALVDLRELLFTHFAREEEGLFPFVAELVPGFAARVQAMAIAHDTICGALARACHLASIEGEHDQLTAVYERFEHAYAEHARSEAELLAALDLQLDAKERDRLATLVEAL
jgi:iron-sulfur cluster repair protein YtfE (RIC family)